MPRRIRPIHGFFFVTLVVDAFLVAKKAFRITEINQGGGGCKPIPLEHRIEDDTPVLDEARILEG